MQMRSYYMCLFYYLLWFILFYFWSHLWHLEVPHPGIKSKPQL